MVVIHLTLNNWTSICIFKIFIFVLNPHCHNQNLILFIHNYICSKELVRKPYIFHSNKFGISLFTPFLRNTISIQLSNWFLQDDISKHTFLMVLRDIVAWYDFHSLQCILITFFLNIFFILWVSFFTLTTKIKQNQWR